MKKALTIEIISFLLVLLFVYAALNKLTDFEKFQAQIGQSPLLVTISPVAAWLIPIGELLISAMLTIPRFKLAGMYLAFGLMLMFTFYIIAILNFSDHIPCSCGGVLEKLGWTEHLIFNIAYTFIALTGVLLLTRKEEQKEPVFN